MAIVKLVPGIKPIIIPACGGASIVLSEGRVFFEVECRFEFGGLDTKSQKTPETRVRIRNLVKDSRFEGMFGAISKEVNSLLMTQTQVIEFVKANRVYLSQAGETFFLFTQSGRLLVADVYMFTGFEKPGVRLYNFKDDIIWYAKMAHRIVAP